jgi:hypothetical protein
MHKGKRESTLLVLLTRGSKKNVIICVEVGRVCLVTDVFDRRMYNVVKKRVGCTKRIVFKGRVVFIKGRTHQSLLGKVVRVK